MSTKVVGSIRCHECDKLVPMIADYAERDFRYAGHDGAFSVINCIQSGALIPSAHVAKCGLRDLSQKLKGEIMSVGNIYCHECNRLVSVMKESTTSPYIYAQHSGAKYAGKPPVDCSGSLKPIPSDYLSRCLQIDQPGTYSVPDAPKSAEPTPVTEFKVGDVVRLKSGGPNMTVGRVASIHPQTDLYVCSWFDRFESKSDTFPKEGLVLQTGEFQAVWENYNEL